MHVLLAYKNFARNQNISHIGLGVSALNTAKVLKKHGITTSILAAVDAKDIGNYIRQNPTITHVVVSAPWIKPDDFTSQLLNPFGNIEFAVNCHSNVAFLQADTNGINLIKQYIELQQGSLNFQMSTNSRKGTRWLRDASQRPIIYLPNMYYLDSATNSHRPLWDGGTLYIGAFGALRIPKNLVSAAGACLQIANQLKADTKFYMSSGRSDGSAGVLSAVKAILDGTRVDLITTGWQTWPKFRDIVRQMHLLINVSFTESFNVVSADGVSEGVPSVVSDAIDWAPENWIAYSDDVNDIADVGRRLIKDNLAAKQGLVSLERHNSSGFEAWCTFLRVNIGYQSLLPDPYLI